MLLSNSKRLKIQGIIKRIAQDKSLTLEERIYVEKFAHHNSSISLSSFLVSLNNDALFNPNIGRL